MNDPIPEDTPPHTTTINHIIKILGFSSDSLMVKCIDKQQWLELAHVVMNGLEDSNGFDLMLIHPNLFQSFLLYSKRQILWEEEGRSETEVMCWTPEEFKTYLTTKAFHDDHA
jgi:hypothetical protein